MKDIYDNELFDTAELTFFAINNVKFLIPVVLILEGQELRSKVISQSKEMRLFISPVRPFYILLLTVDRVQWLKQLH